MNDKKTVLVEFSLEGVTKVILLVLALWFVWKLKSVLLIVFFSYILMSALRPTVKVWEGKGIPKIVSAIGLYAAIILGLFALIVGIFTPLLREFSKLIENIPELINTLVERYSPLRDLISSYNLEDQISGLTTNIANTAIDSSLNFVVSAIGLLDASIILLSIVVLSVYMILDHDKAVGVVMSFIPLTYQKRTREIIVKVENQLGRWMRGQLILSLIIGVMVYVLLLILGVEFALPLAILAGLLEAIPSFGPIVSFIPAWLVVIATGQTWQIIVLPFAYVILQQIENVYIVPMVMKRAVGLNPMITIVSFLVGVELAGIGGALLAIPVAAVVQLLLKEFRK